MRTLPTVGIDSELLERWHSPDTRLFTGAELELASRQPRPQEFFAGRWCAKEAVVKAAWPHIQLSTRDVEILADKDGRPTVTLLTPPTKPLHIDVSITHNNESATAVAIVLPLQLEENHD